MQEKLALNAVISYLYTKTRGVITLNVKYIDEIPDTLSKNGRMDISDVTNADDGAKLIFIISVERKFDENPHAFPDIYFTLSEEFDLNIQPGFVLSRLEENVSEIVEDYTKAAFISYFKSNTDRKFARRFIEEASSTSELKKMKQAFACAESDDIKGLFRILSKSDCPDTVALYLWSRCENNREAMNGVIANFGQQAFDQTCTAAADDLCGGMPDEIQRKIKRRIERKLHKPLEDAIYESYRMPKNVNNAQFILPVMTDEMLGRCSLLAARSVCEWMTAAAVVQRKEASKVIVGQKPDVMSFVSCDAEKAVYEGVYLTAVFGGMVQSIGMSKAVLDEMKKVHDASDSAIKEKCQKEVQAAEKSRDEAIKNMQRAESQNETLKKRALQAEARMRQAKKKPDSEAQKQADEEIRKLRKSLQKLQDEKENLIKKNKEIQEELEIIKEAYAEQPTKEMAKNVDTQAKYLFVTDKDIMCRKLHAWFPNCVISSETDVKSLTGIQFIVFLCAEVSHPEYYRMKRMAQSFGVPSAHCSRISFSAICDCIRNSGRNYGH